MMFLAQLIAVVCARLERIRSVDFDERIKDEICFEATALTPRVFCREIPWHVRSKGVLKWHEDEQPWQYFAEWVLSLVLVVAFVALSMKGAKITPKTADIQPTHRQRRPMPLPVLVFGACHLYQYKFYSSFPEYTFVFTLCHQTWLARFFLHTIPTTDTQSHAIHQLFISVSIGTFLQLVDAVLSTPSVSQLMNWSTFHHSLLLLLPLYDLWAGRVAVLPARLSGIKTTCEYLCKWHFWGCALAIVSQFVVGYVGCLWHGTNVTGNFLVGPHTQGAWLANTLGLGGSAISNSRNVFYALRLVWSFCLFLAGRLFWAATDAVLRLGDLSPLPPSARALHIRQKQKC